MRKIPLGLLTGAGLGFIDGALAAFNPAAQEMLTAIIISATAKGVLTGGAIGLLARKLHSVAKNMAGGAGIGGALSVLAAMPSGAYLEIVIPGVVIGLITGLIVSKWGR